MVKVDIFDGAIPENFDFTVPRPTTPVTVSIAGGGGTANSEPRAFTNDDLIAVREGKKNVLIGGRFGITTCFPARLNGSL